MSKGPVRRIRLRRVVAYPAVSMALVASIALALTPFGPAQMTAFAAEATPTETTAPSPTTTDVPSATPTTVATSSPLPTLVPAPESSPSVTPMPAPVPGPSSVGADAPGEIAVDHHVLARIEGPSFQASYLPVDAPVLDASQFQTLRVRFRMHNAGTTPITASPRLEYRPDASTGYLVVPEKPLKGVPVHLVREWVGYGLGDGTKQGPLDEDLAVAQFRTGNDGGDLAMTGHHSMGANPDRAITLPPSSFTEQEFTVRLTMDAQYLSGYDLRITDGGTALAGQVAKIRLGPPPALRLTPGHRQGVSVAPPKSANPAGVADPLPSEKSTAPNTRAVTAVSSSAASAIPAVFAASPLTVPAAPAATSGTAVIALSPPAVPAVPAASGPVRYPLVVGALSAAAVASSDIHGPYSDTPDQCAVCHRGHTAKAPNLLAESSPSGLCLTCHDGLGASTNVQAQYALARPVNNPAAREYYSHDAEAPSTHTRAELDEFGGNSNRHSECADCHNSHKARGRDSTQQTDGWDASGRLDGVSGVSVVNGGANLPPTYTFLDGVTDLVTREYQLCFKCHSGSTTLTSNEGLKPSQYALDKAVEFNPANPSFHPVEAAGTNQTPKMADSLAGSSRFKLWNFTTGSTVRCLNCHAGGGSPDGTPQPLPLPQPGSALAPHTSSNRGILLENYRDRVLKAGDENYSDMDFALCYTCHGDVPFANETAVATNFSLHGKHVSGLKDKGSGGTDIDTPGAGQGNAICAECHFRLHSTTNKVGTQEIPGTRLVNFAPNVQPVSGTISWTPGTTGSGSCTLTCHGYTHRDRKY